MTTEQPTDEALIEKAHKLAIWCEGTGVRDASEAASTLRELADALSRCAAADDLRAAAQRAYDHVVADAADWFQDGSAEQKAVLVEREALRAALLQSAPSSQPADPLRLAARQLIDLIEAQKRHITPAPRRESIDEENSRDERDQVFCDAIVILEAALSQNGGVA